MFTLVFGWVLGENPGQNIVPLEGDIELSKECIKIWTDFARTGKCPWSTFKTLDDVKILRKLIFQIFIIFRTFGKKYILKKNVVINYLECGRRRNTEQRRNYLKRPFA